MFHNDIGSTCFHTVYMSVMLLLFLHLLKRIIVRDDKPLAKRLFETFFIKISFVTNRLIFWPPSNKRSESKTSSWKNHPRIILSYRSISLSVDLALKRGLYNDPDENYDPDEKFIDPDEKKGSLGWLRQILKFGYTLSLIYK